ncbi:MAG: sugar ABC transporter permease [Bacillota bacterium]|nr:sugar ABC transporter permease [Bacillota bacterium]
MTGLAFIAPWLVGLVVFTLGPFLASGYLSLTSYDMLTPPRFTGLANYRQIFEDPRFYKALGVTFYYALVSVPLDLAVALGLALLLNQRVRGLGLFRTVFYLPAVLPPVVTAVLWNWILNPDFGIVNAGLRALGVPTSHLPQWLVSPEWTVPAYVLMSLWGVGTAMIVSLAGLQDVPRELVEAALLDGAGAWARFRYVTLPMLTPVLFYNLVQGIIAAFGFFTTPFILGAGLGSGAGVDDSGLFYALYVYQQAFGQLHLGYASALAWVMLFLVLLLTLLVFRSSSIWVYYGGERR